MVSEKPAPVAWMMTVGGCVAAFWLDLATAPPGLLVAAYEPPDKLLTVTAPFVFILPDQCAQSTGPAAAGIAMITNEAATYVDRLRPYWRGNQA